MVMSIPNERRNAIELTAWASANYARAGVRERVARYCGQLEASRDRTDPHAGTRALNLLLNNAATPECYGVNVWQNM